MYRIVNPCQYGNTSVKAVVHNPIHRMSVHKSLLLHLSCNHHADSPFYLQPDVKFGDLPTLNIVWSDVTLNALIDARCHSAKQNSA